MLLNLENLKMHGLLHADWGIVEVVVHTSSLPTLRKGYIRDVQFRSSFPLYNNMRKSIEG